MEDLAAQLAYARQAVFVGYGIATAQAQHALGNFPPRWKMRVTVKLRFTVAGRMPGP